MKFSYRLGVVVLIAAISPLLTGTKAVGSQGRQAEPQPDIQILLRDLFASIADGTASYESIRIVGEIGRLGPEASPAIDILIELLGKPFADCEEQLRVCPNNTPYCPQETRVCPAGAEMRKYDYLTSYASVALKQIGDAALPKLSAALDDGTPGEENFVRRRAVAAIMGSIGPAAIPFVSDKLRVSDYSTKRLALEVLHTILSRDPSSGNQLANSVAYITPFLNADFDTVDQAIDVLGAIGPDAAEAVPRLTELLSYKRVLAPRACPVGERTGYVFQSKAIDALIKIGTPEAMKAVERSKIADLKP